MARQVMEAHLEKLAAESRLPADLEPSDTGWMISSRGVAKAGLLAGAVSVGAATAATAAPGTGWRGGRCRRRRDDRARGARGPGPSAATAGACPTSRPAS